jgi:hypothetical protein
VLVGAEDDVGVEDGEQRLEVAVTVGGEDASWRVAGVLRSTIGAIWSKGIAKMSWRTNATRSAGGWGRDLRAWSMLRQTRETTVASQLPRLSTALVSERLKRSHASWTASSASLGEPRIR